MKLFFLALTALSTLSVGAWADTEDDLDELKSDMEDVKTQLQDIQDKLEPPVYVHAPEHKRPSYVLVPLDHPPKPADIPGGYWVESDNPQIGWHWIKGSPPSSNRFHQDE